MQLGAVVSLILAVLSGWYGQLNIANGYGLVGWWCAVLFAVAFIVLTILSFLRHRDAVRYDIRR